MKKQNYLIVSTIVIAGFLYLLTSFVQMQMNPYCWSVEAREVLAHLFLILTIFNTAFAFFTLPWKN